MSLLVVQDLSDLIIIFFEIYIYILCLFYAVAGLHARGIPDEADVLFPALAAEIL